MIRFLGKKKNELIEVDTSQVEPNPDQPRKNFDMYEISRLAESIRLNGMIQPLTVKKTETGYRLIAGERRLKAAIMAGLVTVPCIVTCTDRKGAAYISLVENTQRQDLTMFEEAEGIARLIDEFSVSQYEAAERLGMAQSTLSNKLRLLRLTESERRRITKASLSERHARALIRLTDAEERETALNRIIAENMNIHECEEYIEKLIFSDKAEDEKAEKQKNQNKAPCFFDSRILTNTFSKFLDSVRRAGFNATGGRNETEEFVEFILKIPKPPKDKAI